MRPNTFSLVVLMALMPVSALLAQNQYDARIETYKGLTYSCDGEVTPVLRIQNAGSNSMFSCVVETWPNGVVDNSFDWLLPNAALPLEYRQPSFPVVSGVVDGDVLEFHIISVNNQPDEDTTGNTYSVTIGAAPAQTTTYTVQVEVLTDGAPAETEWCIVDRMGAAVVCGGPYVTPNAIETAWVTLDPAQCYALRLNDSGGDGMGAGHCYVYSDGVEVIAIEGTDLTDAAERGLKVGTAMGIERNTAGSGFTLVPNPATATVRIEHPSQLGSLHMTLYDLTGRVVLAHRMVAASTFTFDVSALPSGLYTVELRSDDGQRSVEQLVVGE